MSGRRRHTLSPSLFPFLAVLICTLGTLILMLALVAQNTSDAAQQIADAVPELQLPDPDTLTVGDVHNLVEEEAFRLGELISFREAQTGDLEDRRNMLAHVDDHIRRIRQRLNEISDAMEQAMSDQPLPVATADEVSELKQQLVTEQLVVEKLREVIKTEKPRFVIVPHQGPNGTTRRPIYLECTSEGVMIWPEGVAISLWQLEHSSADANPLDDALRAARYHAMQNYGDTIPPYPMLLVRPDGVETYYVARAAMRDWDDQFGYEMVPSDIKLAYPTPDPSMRERLEYAVKTAGQRVSQQSIARTIGGRGSRYPGAPGDRGNAGHRDYPNSNGQSLAGRSLASRGNTDRTGDSPTPYRPKRVPQLSVSQMDRRGRQSGFRDHRMLPSRSVGGGSSGGNQPLSAEAAKRRLERQLEESASLLAKSDSDGALDQATTTALNQIVGSGTIGEASQANSAQTEFADSKPNDVDYKVGESMLMPSTDFSVGGDSTAKIAGHADNVNRQQPGQKPNSLTEDNPGAVGSAGRSMTSMGQQAQRSASQRLQAQTAQDSTRSSAQPRSSQQRSPGDKPMVNRGGSDWALPSSVAFGRGNEIVRSVRIQVHRDRLLVMPSSGVRMTETFLIVPSGMDSATLLMATAIRDRIERWGAAAPGARWSPRLKVDVMQGADQRFHELEKLLIGSGLPIERSRYSQADAKQREGLR